MKMLAFVFAVLSIVAPGAQQASLPEFSTPPAGAPDTSGWEKFQAEGVLDDFPVILDERVSLFTWLAAKQVFDRTATTVDLAVRFQALTLKAADGQTLKAVLRAVFRGPSGTVVEVFDLATGTKLEDHHFWVRAGGEWSQVTDQTDHVAVYDMMYEFAAAALYLSEQGVLRVVP